MAVDVSELSGVIAANVRRLRAARTWSLDALAEEAELSKGTVVAIEQGRANPSVATLCSLSEALGVGLMTLLEPSTRPLLKLRTPDQAIELWRTERGSSARMLLGTDPPDAVELWSWRLAGGDGFDGGAHPRGTVETLLVHVGRLRVTLDGRSVEAGPGEAVAFEAHAPHRYEAAGDGAVAFTMWITVGETGELPPLSTVGDDRDRVDGPTTASTRGTDRRGRR